MVTEPRRPWWQATRAPRAGFFMGTFWIVFGLLRWVWLGSDETLSRVLSGAFVLMGAAYVASSLALVRRGRGPDAAG